jgi:hypothetical protein
MAVDTSNCFSSIKVGEQVNLVIDLYAQIMGDMESRWISNAIEAYLRLVIDVG